MTRRRLGLALATLLLAVPLVVAQQTGGGGITPAGGRPFGAGGTVTGPIRFPDGTAPLPAMAFASEPTLGFWRSAAGTITNTGTLIAVVFNTSSNSGTYTVSNRGGFGATADGLFAVRNNAQSLGINLKVDALPTVASGFGTSPSVTAGSTPLAGSVNVGTGGVATSGVLNFNGTAFPSAPFCLADTATSNTASRVAASATQLTLTTTVAWTASDVVSWICISSK